MRLGLWILFVLAGCQSPKYADSPHYDGEKFFNPWLKEEDKSFWQLLKWRMTGNPKDWPEQVENPPMELNVKDTSKIPEGEVYVTFINHSTCLIQTKDLTLITDPVYSKRVSPVSFAGPARVRPPAVPFDKLPKIDVVIISHNHYDHLDLDTLEKISKRDGSKFIVPLGDKDLLEVEGIDNVLEADWWQEFQLTDITSLTMTPVQHWSARGLFDRRDSLWGGYVISQKNKQIYFAGDTGYGPHFLKTKERFKTIDLSLIPIGAYLPRWFMKTYHVNPKESVQAHLDLESKQSIGIHFGTFKLTDEGIDDPKADLIQAKKERSVPDESFVVPIHGKTVLYKI